MYSTNQFRRGLKIEVDGDPYNIVYFQHVKPGKGNAFVRTKLKNLVTGNVLEKTFKSGEKVGKPDLEKNAMQYMYSDGEDYNFMNLTTYESIMIPAENLGDATNFLKENIDVEVLFYKGSAIDIELPTFLNFVITQTDPGVRGDTVSGSTKPATIETGAVVQVPLFVEEGEKIRIDTRTGDYVERVKE
ncbi:MAG: elongation factor P [Deltaproteobacteria bacterium]|nr:elongation factor P [Deltaproteobacteria bacterium]MBU48173.1 elongation factor P [Deltaproteobacteria bacterium]|tara:strand:- start:1727 stop:2290 length:564 start_codon:yes stop_codon:yes gene_type:complete